MSFTTVFDSLPSITSTTTATALITASDPVLVHSTNLKNKGSSTVGAIASLQSVTQITTLTTGTLIPSYGLSVINTTSGTANNVSWTLADPMVAGLCKTFFCISTSTTTPVTLIINFNTATGISTDVGSGSITSVSFGQAAQGYGGYFELQAQTTASWLVVGRSAANSHTS